MKLRQLLDEQSKIIALFGATGLVGQEVLKLLQSRDSVSQIIVIGRSCPSVNMNKVIFLGNDLNSVELMTELLLSYPIEAGICCLGTTMKKAGNRAAFYQVDHDYILNCAKASYDAGARIFGLVSSVGANPHSPNFYLQVKGKTEEHLTQLGFKKLVIQRPGPLLGERKEFRLGERLLTFLSPILIALLQGRLKKYRPVTAHSVATDLVDNCLS
jgi:uncharacterized protein YbjT (DUF2867 family)